MQDIAVLLCDRQMHVLRFEFPYMERRRIDGRKRPPDALPKLQDRWREMLTHPDVKTPLFIGGKSMGGRVASLIATETPKVSGLVCLGFPFHPPGQPERTRIDHWPRVLCPSLIVQGSRDPFGKPEEVASYGLPASVQVLWIAGGNHDLATGSRAAITSSEALVMAADGIKDFIVRNLPANSAVSNGRLL